jgi:hypothetical protein
MPATLAAYVPVCTSCFTAHHTSSSATPYQQPQTPAPKQQQQDLMTGGIIILICLAGFLFLALIDRR